MKQVVLDKITALDAQVIVFDIDGTLKDLVKEHKETLARILNGFVKGKKIRKNMVYFIDKIAMWFVKAGILSTNERKQKALTTMYAIILNQNIYNFNELYKFFYNEYIIFFDETEELLSELFQTKQVYFVTINKKNSTINKHGIIGNKMIYTISKKKVKAYQKLFEEKELDKSKAVIIGDNLFDDIKAAKKLKIKYLLVDNYDSKFKRFVARLFNVGK